MRQFTSNNNGFRKIPRKNSAINRKVRRREQFHIHNFSEIIINALNNILNGRKCSLIRAIGIGNFSKPFCNGCDQLALLLQLKQYFGAKTIYQDPVVTENEKVT